VLRWSFALLLLASGCLPSAGPERPEVSHRQQRLLRASFHEVWTAAHAAIEETPLRITVDDESDGTMTLFLRRTARLRADELVKELTRIADLSQARSRGLQSLNEYIVEYDLSFTRMEDEATRLEVGTRIAVIDKSEAIMIGGAITVIPRRFDVPSKGVLEKELVLAIGSRLFVAEEMLYSFGLLGRD
jgi:hypothetical protein